MKFTLIPILSPFFRFSIQILSVTLILPISQLQTQWLITSQFRSRIGYLIPTYNILVLFYTQILTQHLLAFLRRFKLLLLFGRGFLYWTLAIYSHNESTNENFAQNETGRQTVARMQLIAIVFRSYLVYDCRQFFNILSNAQLHLLQHC